MQILQIKREELVKQGLVLIRGSYPLFSTLLNLSNVVFLSVFCSFTLYHQVYSNTRVPTRVNTNQHGSTRVRHESTRVNTNQHESNTSQHKSDTSQHESTRVNTTPTRVNTKQHESKTGLDHEKEKNMAKRKDKT